MRDLIHGARHAGFSRRTLALSVALVAVCGLAACQSVMRSDGTLALDAHSQKFPVPGSAPDSVPSALFDSLGVIHESGATWQRGAIVLMFNPSTPQRERQTVIDSLDGRVVGGLRGEPGPEGRYLVRVHTNTLAASESVSTVARGLPQVFFAFPFSRDSARSSSGEAKP